MADGAKGTAGDVYVLDTGGNAAERLRLLDDVYGAFTRQLLIHAGVGPGKRVLDVACGIGTISCWLAGRVGSAGSVVAADVNPDQLVVAKGYWNEREDLQPVEFIEASAYDTGLPSESFDIVHCRLLLCHLTKPENALGEMRRVLKPGGVLVSQELRLSNTLCYPDSPAYMRTVSLALEAGRRLGVNYDYGVELPAAVMDAGFQSPEVRVDLPAFLRGPGKRMWEHTYAEAIPAMVRTGVSREDELLDLLEVMRSVAADEQVLVAPWALIGVVAKK
jgi:SAM-dependent methyltransferase